MGLGTYVTRRLLLAVPVLFGAAILVFAVVQFLPVGVRAVLFITSEKQIPHLDEIIREYHLNDPAYIQFFCWLKALLIERNSGLDRFGDPVLNALLSRLPATIEIVMFASPLIVLIGVYLGVFSGANKDKLVDHASRVLAILGSSMPSFWFGIILLSIFFAGLGWFPPSRIGQETLNFITAPNTSWRWYTHLVTVDSLLNGQWWIFLDGIRHLILPVAILALLNSAIIVRVTRSSMLEALSKDYITAAKAKGLTRRLVINRYARRNALIPAITLAGLMIASLFTGITITETVFDMGGIGAYTAELARSLDMSSANWYALPCAIDFILYNPSRRHPL